MDKTQCERYYDRVAHRYDDSYKTPYWDFYNALTWHNLKKHLPRNLAAKILDIGGGTGLWALKLAKSGYNVTLTDLSQKMLDTAQHKANSTGLSRKITSIKADICDLSMFEPESFDLVIAQGDPLSYCHSPAQAIREVHRTLKPKGIFIASVDNKFAGMRIFVEQNAIDELESFIRTGRTNWFTRNEEERYPITYFSPDELCKLFTTYSPLTHSRSLSRFQRGSVQAKGEGGCFPGFEIISLIGKPVLPLRANSEMLADKEIFNRLLKLELKLNSKEHLLGQAGHLEITARRL